MTTLKDDQILKSDAPAVPCDESSLMAVAPARIVGCTSCPSSCGRAVGRRLRGWTSRARPASQLLDTFGQVENDEKYENDETCN